jgi:hypothetical protein
MAVCFLVLGSSNLLHMWCSTCQQDTPALGSASEGTLRCGKCSGALTPALAPTANTSQVSTQTATLEKLFRNTPLSNEDWAIEAELRGVQRLLSSLKTRPSAIDYITQAPHSHLRSPAQKTADSYNQATLEPRHSPAKPHPQARLAAWTVLTIGLTLFACGVLLLAWSFIVKRNDLWPLGVPLMFIGQAGLILGLVLQLNGLWSTNRQTAAVLSDLDQELKTVREATTLLSTSHSSAGQSFYLHLAEGASPHILLADLKGQLDLLAQQMARHSRL